jgi:hypothetical protein
MIFKFVSLVTCCVNPLGCKKYGSQQHLHNSLLEIPSPLLVQIMGTDGSVTRNPTVKQYNNSRAVGTSWQMKCYVCCKYLSIQGKTVYRDTSFCCKTCHSMPLCKRDRQDTENGRLLICLDEHLSSVDEDLGCR